MNLFEQSTLIQSSEDLAAFVLALRADLQKNHTKWENATLDAFLGSLAAWISDMPGYYANMGRPAPSQPDWRVIADMLMGARVYE
jgi:hypothetical protein